MKKKILEFSLDLIFYACGCAIYAVAVTMLISANSISPGGITGISTALTYLFGVPSGLLLLLLNLPILIIGFFKLGGFFIAKTFIVTIMASLFLDISEAVLPKLYTDKILAALFGGILMGLGLSLVILRGATTGGIDIIAKLINRKFRHFTVGRLILLMDAGVISFAAIIYQNIESALYSVLAMYASSKIMDTVLYGADKGKIIYIITSFPDDICKTINNRLNRGITRLKAVGAYTGEDKEMLMCTVRRHEVHSVYSIINEYDAGAFIVVGEAGEIIGEGFKAIS